MTCQIISGGGGGIVRKPFSKVGNYSCELCDKSSSLKRKPISEPSCDLMAARVGSEKTSFTRLDCACALRTRTVFRKSPPRKKPSTYRGVHSYRYLFIQSYKYLYDAVPKHIGN
ncbi:unnamed protein product [Nesidiocoris tenuis]|uniref:Uncharacterized protein n=1 Tax=Nesidiocoris tenuis TaxID=355587 RepID=A0A6H5HL96_9HEMI|nr:unnamed protein product [Nesidiocoris tenuis]